MPGEEDLRGGYLPHRYSRENGFDNPSVWCADILKLFSLIRRRLEVTVKETNQRRRQLARMSARVSRGRHSEVESEP